MEIEELKNKEKDNIKLTACYLHLIHASELIKDFNIDISTALLETAAAILDNYQLQDSDISSMINTSDQIVKISNQEKL